MRAGDACPLCGHALESARGIEMGHIFQLGTKYAEALDLKVLDQNGKLRDRHHGLLRRRASRAPSPASPRATTTSSGCVWPRELAPADVHIVATGKDEAVAIYAEELARELEARGVTVLLDDRQVSPGVKFKDSELIGVPTIVVVGRGLADGTVEVKDRRSGERRDWSPSTSARRREILAEIGRS